MTTKLTRIIIIQDNFVWLLLNAVFHHRSGSIVNRVFLLFCSLIEFIDKSVKCATRNKTTKNVWKRERCNREKQRSNQTKSLFTRQTMNFVSSNNNKNINSNADGENCIQKTHIQTPSQANCNCCPYIKIYTVHFSILTARKRGGGGGGGREGKVEER